MKIGFKTRLSLGHMLVVAVILGVVAVVSDWALSRFVLGLVDSELLAVSRSEATALIAESGAVLRVHETPEAGPPAFIRLDKFIQIVDPEGRVVVRSATLGAVRLPTPPRLLSRLQNGEAVFETLHSFAEDPIRLLSVPVELKGRLYVLQVAAPLDDAAAVLRGTRWLQVGMALAILAAVGITGTVLARRALRPIDDIVQRARRIREASLSERLPHPGTLDEVGRLVETLNEMLARIAQSFEAQKRFTADASHELRSPLSRLRAELEVALRRRRTPVEYEDTLASCLDEVQRLSRLTEDLLMLARLDAGESSDVLTAPAALSPVLDEAIARLEPEARRRQVTLKLEATPDLRVKVAAGGASVILANVLDNAVKYSPRGGQVVMRASAEGDEAIIAVSDTGPGVDPQELPRLFERFHRGGAARENQEPGVGLGLAISHALAQRQGGRIVVESAPGRGATFTIHLPLTR
jgi:two-component system OmpR family sensor kinase